MTSTSRFRGHLLKLRNVHGTMNCRAHWNFPNYEKAGLKLNIQKSKTMASSTITSWQIGGGKMQTVTGFIFLGSKITVDTDCSHEIKRYLLLGRKAMANLDSILKRERHHFANKGMYSQSCGFSSSHVCRYKSWAIMKAEC